MSWVMHGYDYGPIALETVGWLIALLFAAGLAHLLSMFAGPAYELVRFGLVVLLMVVVTPLAIYGTAATTGHVLPSMQPNDHYIVDRAAYDRWHSYA